MKFPLSTFHFPPAIARLLPCGAVRQWRAGPLSTRASRGFTVIELLVTMAIFSVLSGVVLANYRDYTTGAYFANASENIVLALRQAQVYGAGGKLNTASCIGGLYMCHYGVSFVKGSDHFTMFVDSNDDQIFSPVDTVLETVVFESPIEIGDLFCGVWACNPANGLNIVFIRPYTDAWIADIPANLIIGSSSYDYGSVTITDGQSKYSTLIISRAGQISIQ